MTINLDHAVLLPIDMQRAFDTSPWPRRWNDKVDANGLALLDLWRRLGRPIIHVRHDSVIDGSSLAPGAEASGDGRYVVPAPANHGVRLELRPRA